MVNFDVVEKEIKKSIIQNNLKFPVIPAVYLQSEDLDLEKQIHYLIYQITKQILTKFIYILTIHMKQSIKT